MIRPAPRYCRICGCTERGACVGGCTWVLLDIDRPTAICSACAHGLEWDPILMARVGLEERDYAS